MHYPVDRDSSIGYCYPPFEQLGPGCLLLSQLVHIQVLLLVIHFCCVNRASSETHGQIVGARGSVNILCFSLRHFFPPVYTPPPHPRNYLPLGLRGCFKMCKAQLFSRSEFTSKSPFLCVNKIPVVSGLFFFSFFFIKLCLIIYCNPWSKPKG